MLEEYADILTVEEVCEALRIGENAAYALLAADSSKATATAAAGGSPRKQSVGSSWSAPGWDNVKAPGMTAVIPGV